MALASVLALVMRWIDIVLGVIGLLLILRMVLRIFGMRPQHPVLRLVVLITDPILQATNRLLGAPAYRYTYTTYSRIPPDILGALASLLVLWALRTVLIWLLRLGLLIPLWLASPVSGLAGMVYHVLNLLFDLYELALFARIVFQWLQLSYTSRMMRWLWQITEPILAPIRQVLPPFAGLDFSPLVAFLLLRLLRSVVFMMLAWIL